MYLPWQTCGKPPDRRLAFLCSDQKKNVWRIGAFVSEQGVLRVGQKVEVRPGISSKDAEGKMKCVPIFSRIISLFAEQNELQFAVPGGLIGVGTTIDPTLTRADRLVGQVLGEVGQLPDVFTELEVSCHMRGMKCYFLRCAKASLYHLHCAFDCLRYASVLSCPLHDVARLELLPLLHRYCSGRGHTPLVHPAPPSCCHVALFSHVLTA